MHVLELADRLGLTPEQRTQTQDLMRAHKEDARAIGAKLVAAEQALDSLFRSGKLEQPTLEQAVRAAAEIQGSYRLSHLETHRRMHALLSAEQIAKYDALRGYTEHHQGKH
jgi:Spy/CpxP family protein refolding chaperone